MNAIDEERRNEAWVEYNKKNHVIEDIAEFFKDPEAMIELSSGMPIAKLVNNELELKQFLLRFGNWDHEGKFTNIDALDYFEEIAQSVVEFMYYARPRLPVEEREDEVPECEGLLNDTPCKILKYNQFSEPGFSYREAVCYGLMPEEILIKEDIKYPSIVRIYVEDTDDRLGDVKFRMITIIPVEDIMTGRMVLV